MPATPDRAHAASPADAYYERYWTDDGYNPRRTLPPAVAAVLEGVLGRDRTCLDVGCGDGHTAGAWLTERSATYVGVDVSRTAVETARSSGLDARVIDDASTLPFDDAAFDIAVCLEVLEHLSAPSAAAREIWRVLKPGGVLVVSVPNIAYWQRRAEHCMGIWNPYGDDKSITEPWRDPHVRFFTARALHDMLEHVGFDDVEVFGHEGVAYTATIPGLRAVRGLRFAQPLYDRCQQRWPGLFGARLHAVAVKRP